MATQGSPSLFSGETSRQSELRIVLIGGRELGGIEASGKSSVGNTILCSDLFETGRRTAQCVVKQQEVYGRQLTVIDTPGWWWNYPRANTPTLDQLQIKQSVFLCPPGPHAFLLIIPVDSAIPDVSKRALEEHLELFHESVWQYTIVVFSTVATCDNERFQNHQWPALQQLIKQCGNRSHVLDIKNRADSTQVTELLEKIEKMVAGNGGCHYETERDSGQKIGEELQEFTEKAKERFEMVQTQRKRLRTLIEGGANIHPYLRLVIVGAQCAARSSAGNTILGEDVFKVGEGRTTMRCETRHGEVAGRQLSVVDSPGWLYNYALEDTSELDKLEIQRSLYQCPPGPHAILLAVPLATAFNESYRRAVEEHMSLLPDKVWDHTIVLFTRGDWLGHTTAEERIESEGTGLKWLVEKCGNRYHVFDNKNRSDGAQVTDLLDKVEEMVAGNSSSHYEIDIDCLEQLEAQKREGEERAKDRMKKVQRQRTVLRELLKGERERLASTKLRTVLLGRRGAGKSGAGNAMIFEDRFPSHLCKEFKIQHKTRECEKQKWTVAGNHFTVVDTPGWQEDTPEDAPDSAEELVHSVSLCSPGPHAFLLVVPIVARFTKRDLRHVMKHLTPLTERVWRHTLVLFTWGDWLGDRPIEEYIETEGEALQWLIEKCGNRYHVFDCYDWGNGSQVTGLLAKIQDMVTRNKGQHFTTEEKKVHRSLLHRLSGKGALTEEDWDKREEELIDRMLRAVVAEPDESKVMRRKSFDMAFIPSMSGDASSEVGTSLRTYSAAYAKVSGWLAVEDSGATAASSGHGTMGSSDSIMETLHAASEKDEDQENII